METFVLVHSHLYASQYDALVATFPLLFDIQAGIDWAAHKSPDAIPLAFPADPDREHFRLLRTTTADAAVTPVFRVLIEIKRAEQEVELLAIDVAQSNGGV